MRDAWFAITGSSAEATEQAHGIVRLVGGRATEIAEAHRPLYHAALCHASNHLVTLLADAFAMLDAAQVDESRALVAPLVRAAGMTCDHSMTKSASRSRSASPNSSIIATRRSHPVRLHATRE